VSSSALLGASMGLEGCRAKEAVKREPAQLQVAAGDAAEGARLVERFECKRCHADLQAAAVPFQKSCVDCHQAIVSGKATADPEALNRWQQHVRHLVELPRVSALQSKLRHAWVEKFLLAPHDVRPALEESMPRLRLTREQARDLASFLAPRDAAFQAPAEGDAAKGRRLLDERGCGTCHTVRGAPALKQSAIGVAMTPARLSRAIRFAPDLGQVRDRLLPGYLERWLTRPSAVDPDALMPDIPLSPAEVTDIASYLLSVRPLAEKPNVFVRLPLLARKVAFSEVKTRVFRNTCWHCHSDPDYAIGDGGPGNTGGFGFAGRLVNLAEHEGVLSGYVDDQGTRKSLFVSEPPEREGRLVQALLARHAEEAGAPTGPVRGMPLGLPALPAEDIQLVESWIAQGRTQ
jgi:cytochrome c2